MNTSVGSNKNAFQALIEIINEGAEQESEQVSEDEDYQGSLMQDSKKGTDGKHKSLQELQLKKKASLPRPYPRV